MVRLSTLLYFYRRRLQVHGLQELLAGLGIAVGVALIFSVQITNSSITGSAREIVRGLTGGASLQVSARGASGFDDGTLRRVRALPGVSHAAAILEQRATVAYAGHRVAIDLVGLDLSLAELGGFAARHFQLGGLVVQHGLLLPTAVGAGLALPETSGRLPRVALDVRGRRMPVKVTAVLGNEAVGALSGAFIGVAPLDYAQAVTHLPHRISRLVVMPKPGQQRAVTAGLKRIAAGRLLVAPLDEETRALEQATGPISQSTGLFAAISGLVGVLFTFTAMLLTVPERRRFIADLRIMGYRRARVAQILGFQAIVLGVAASLVGLLAGYALSRIATQDPPGYLAFAFPLGSQRTIGWQELALSLGGGVLATCLAAAQPLLDLRRGRPVNSALSDRGEPGHGIAEHTARRLVLGALVLTGATTIALLIVPALTIVGVAAIAVAAVLTIPATFTIVLRAAEVPANRWRLNALALAIRTLRATSMRSLALAATGAVAVFGSVAIEGAHQNLLHGLYGDYRGYVGTTDVWISQPGDDLALQPFDERGLSRRVMHVPGVRAVRSYGGGLLDLGGRRVWVIARSPGDRTMIPPHQILSGTLAGANARLRAGGWVTVSRQIADALGAKPRQTVLLPTPTGVIPYRLAATTTNLGWGPGAIIMNDDDYRSAWATDSPSALEVDLVRGANPVATSDAIRRALGSDSGLQVQTTAERAEHANGIARDGLVRLSQISTLLLIAAALAMASAMGAGIWQRRVALAQLRIMGWRPLKLWRALLLETGMVLGVGCLSGAVAGIYGHFLGDRWLALTTGYPAPFTFTGFQATQVCLLVGLAALVVTAIPGFLVSRTPARLGLNSTA